MRKSQITIQILTALENEPQLLSDLVTYLKNLKANDRLDKATISTQEIDVPVQLEL